MPEGDTLHRTAAGLRPYLVGQRIVDARARQPGPQVERIVGREVAEVLSIGKNLLIRFEGGLELRTHLGMHGSWHRYRPGEPWRRPAARARLVLETPTALAVCFDAPTVEIFETRAEGVHPVLANLGPNVTDLDFDTAEAFRRLRDPGRAGTEIAEALLDQRVLAGVGNVYKSETLFAERVNPFAAVGDLDGDTLGRLVATAHRLMVANLDRASRVTVGGEDRGVDGDGGGARAAARTRLWVYGRAGRPCRRCGTLVMSRPQGANGRRTYWCPRCQPDAVAEASPRD